MNGRRYEFRVSFAKVLPAAGLFAGAALFVYAVSWLFRLQASMIGHASAMTHLSVHAAYLVAVACLLVPFGVVAFRSPVVTLSSQGVEGKTAWGAARFVAWDDIAGVADSHFISVKYVKLQPRGGATPLIIPLSVTAPDDFARTVARLAPEGNPLRVRVSP